MKIKPLNNITILLLLILCCSYFGHSQNDFKPILTPKIKTLESDGKRSEAASLLIKNIKSLASIVKDKNIAADSIIKHYSYFLQLEKDIDKRGLLHEFLINLRETAPALDTLGLIEAYYYYASDLSNVAFNYSKTLVYTEKGLAIWEKYYSKPTDLYGKLNIQKGSVLQNLRLEGESFVQYEKTVKIYESIKNKNELYLFSLYEGLVKSYSRYGFYDKAIYYLEKAISTLQSDTSKKLLKEIASQQGDEHQYMISSLANYIRIYDFAKNETLLLESIKNIETYISNKSLGFMSQYQVSGAYNHAGLFYLNSKEDYNKALHFFEKALEAVPKEHFKVYADYYTLNIIKAKTGLITTTKSLNALRTFLAKRPSLPRQLKGFAYVKMATLNAKSKNYSNAINNAQFVITNFSKSKIPLNLLDTVIVNQYKPTKQLTDVRYIVSMAETFNNLENKNDSLLIVTNHLFKIALKQFKVSYKKNFYTEDLEDLYGKIIKGIMTTNRLRYGQYINGKKLLNDIINDKSKFLWHNFLVNRNNDHLKIPDSLTSKERMLRQKLLLYQTKEIEENYTSEEYKLLITSLKEEIESVTRNINNNYATYSFFDDNSFDLSQFTSSLSKDEAVIYYLVLDNNLFSFFITKEKIEISNRKDFKSLENKILNFIKKTSNLNSKISNLKDTGKVLYDALDFKKIKNYSKITIVPDKVLHYLPFELLVKDNKYLIETKNITYTTALPLLQYGLAQKPSLTNSSKTLLFAPSYDNLQINESQLAVRAGKYNLQGALEEVKAVKKITKGKIFSGNKASKDNFIMNAEKDAVLHLAMHAFLNNENPELSNLVFSDNIEDNRMYISELYGLNLKSKLAVLSACNTGVGGIRSGKGVVSLNRAFIYAGVPTTISSLWSSPDEATQSIMVNFYKNIDAGLITSEALQQAKLMYINDVQIPELKHPYYWAGFVQHGKDIKLSFKNTDLIWEWVLAFSLIAIVVFLIFRASKRKT